ncbi:MAG: helix-turn-helix domain-containing protein [Oscillospiraceae bacterium]|jgi:excisionase family DNA binding protein|nr:helix-turn-helix domain-containing protein [Oscillospiraceae bacterium]
MANLLTCAQVAERFGVSVATVWRWIGHKELRAIKLSRKSYRIRPEDLAEFERRHETTDSSEQISE